MKKSLTKSVCAREAESGGGWERGETERDGGGMEAVVSCGFE